MIKNDKEVLGYWNDPKIESMYDKYLLKLEIELIQSKLMPSSKILDAGCGEGEGTLEYSKTPGVEIEAVDFSETRLEKAQKNLAGVLNVNILKRNLLEDFNLDTDFDFIISQRFLINLMEWELQKQVILKMKSHVKIGGKIILLEGSIDGVNQLNEFRKLFGLEPIHVKWHNLFFDDNKLEMFFKESGLRLLEKDGLGEYFMLTRGIRPYFDSDLDWNNIYNVHSSNKRVKEILNFNDRFSRLKLWIVERIE
jgi:SAM-dependent methyltransferase